MHIYQQRSLILFWHFQVSELHRNLRNTRSDADAVVADAKIAAICGCGFAGATFYAVETQLQSFDPYLIWNTWPRCWLPPPQSKPPPIITTLPVDSKPRGNHTTHSTNPQYKHLHWALLEAGKQHYKQLYYWEMQTPLLSIIKDRKTTLRTIILLERIWRYKHLQWALLETGKQHLKQLNYWTNKTLQTIVLCFCSFTYIIANNISFSLIAPLLVEVMVASPRSEEDYEENFVETSMANLGLKSMDNIVIVANTFLFANVCKRIM